MNEPGEYLALDKVRAGDEGILSFVGAADSTVQRLMSMGLIPGAFVKVTRVAPLGDPIMLEICGYSVCVRRKEASSLAIRKERSASGELNRATPNHNNSADPNRAGSADPTILL